MTFPKRGDDDGFVGTGASFMSALESNSVRSNDNENSPRSPPHIEEMAGYEINSSALLEDIVREKRGQMSS